MKKYLILLLITIYIPLIYSQYCKQFHKTKYCWMNNVGNFKQYGKARSALMEIKKTYSYELVLTPRKDFKIGVCTEPIYAPIQFKIIDKEKGTIIFDNSTDNYIETIGFTVYDSPLPIIIEVTILATKFTPKDMEDLRTCAGIQIMFSKIAQEGF